MEDDIMRSEPARNGTSVAWSIFWVGFVVYSACSVYPGLNISLKYFQAAQAFGLVLVLVGSAFLLRWKIESSYLRILFPVYMLWSIITVFRGFNFNYDFLKIMLFYAPFSVFLYFVPLVMVFKNSMENIRKIVPVIISLSFVFILYSLLFRDIILHGTYGVHRAATGITEAFAHFLSIPAAFLVLTYPYHKKKVVFFALAMLILTFLAVTIRARRGLMFMTICFLFFSYIVFFFTNKGKILKVLMSVAIFGFVIAYGYFEYSRNMYSTFGLLTTRLNEDTRSLVVDAFYEDMAQRDWIIGRGVDGKYYCPNISRSNGEFLTHRVEIETGYLQIILKGGLVSLILYLLITIPAIFIGLLSSKNVLTKASAIWIFLYTLFLYPTYVNMFSLTYILIWMSVGICYSKSVRSKTDDEIKALFQK